MSYTFEKEVFKKHFDFFLLNCVSLKQGNEGTDRMTE